MSPIIIRLATIDDAELIAEISRQTFFDTFASFNTKENMDKFMNEQFTEKLLINEVASDRNTFLLAYMQEEIVGYALVREGYNPVELENKPAIEIARFYATKKNIGKGVGKALMQKCIDIAVEKEKHVIWLCVWSKNERAIEFYIKKGFEKFGEHIFMLGNDAQNDWKMKKNL